MPKRLKPGIYEEPIKQAVSSAPNGTAMCLKWDGRKVSPGFHDDSGDIDLLGCEETATLDERKSHQKELDLFFDEKINYVSSALFSSDNIKTILRDVVKILGTNNKELRELKEKKERTIESLKSKSGNNWKDGKFKNAILSLQGMMIKLSDQIERGLALSDRVCENLSHLNGRSEWWTNNSEVCVKNLQNYYDTPLPDCSIPGKPNPLFLKQRSDEWFDLKKFHPVSGSSISSISGLGTLKEKQQKWNEYHRGAHASEVTSEVQKAMQHGCQNEVNAIATACTKIIPSLFPDLAFSDIGSVIIDDVMTEHTHDSIGKCAKSDTRHPFILVSPDGVLVKEGNKNWKGINDFQLTVEFKSPYFKPSAHLEIPKRYFPQLEFESHVSSSKCTLFVSSHREFSTAFIYQNDTDFTLDLMKEAQSNFMESAFPKRFSETSKELKENLGMAKERIKFLGEFRTVFNTDENVQQTSSMVSGASEYDIDDTTSLLVSAKQLLQESYEIKRQRATEAVTFLLSDTDRSNAVYGVIASYMLTGYSLPCKIMRNIANKVYLTCVSLGANICAFAYDGQWHAMMAKGLDDKPHTMYQLQQSIWNEVTSLKKPEIIQSMSLLNANVCHEFNFVKLPGGPMLVESLYPIKVSSFPNYIGAHEHNDNLSSPFPATEQVTVSTQLDDNNFENQQVIEAENNIIGDDIEQNDQGAPLHKMVEEDWSDLERWLINGEHKDKNLNSANLRTVICDINALYRCTLPTLKTIL